MREAFKIGTRGSPLALWQSNWVRNRLLEFHPLCSIELVVIRTAGDKIPDTPLARIDDKGLFTREIEKALFDGEVDLAVHSLKDLPTTLPEGLRIAAVPEREDPRDVLVARKKMTIEGLPENAVVATGSLRRQAQLLHLRPDVRIAPIRGNIGTRLRRFEESEADATILARAGIVRLGYEKQISCVLEPNEILSAVAQGALGIEIREDDAESAELVSVIHDETAAIAVSAERAFLNRLHGGCKIPVAALARVDGTSLHLDGLIASPGGKRYFRGELVGQKTEGEFVGAELAERLLRQGGDGILRELE